MTVYLVGSWATINTSPMGDSASALRYVTKFCGWVTGLRPAGLSLFEVGSGLLPELEDRRRLGCDHAQGYLTGRPEPLPSTRLT